LEEEIMTTTMGLVCIGRLAVSDLKEKMNLEEDRRMWRG
jgi:hypothetical protein